MLGIAIIPAGAKDQIGSSTVAGRPVTLFSDFTWEYAATPAATNCSDVNGTIQFCGDTTRWKFTPTASPIIAAQYQYDASQYGEYIFERLGRSNGLTAETMTKIAVQNAAMAAQVNTSNVSVIEQANILFEGEPAITVVYTLKFQGLPIVFANTIVVRDGYTVQIVTYAIMAEYTQAHRDLHAEFLQNTKLL